MYEHDEDYIESIVLARRTVKSARKEHLCYMCGQAILVGQSYHRAFGLVDGEPYTQRHHADYSVCARILEEV